MQRNKIIQEDLEFIVNQDINWKRFQNKTVFISGANGFLPAYVVETLLFLNEKVPDMNIKIVALVRNIKKAQIRFAYYEGRPDLTFIVQDVNDPIKYDGKIDFILHAASQASPKYYGKDPVGTLKANTVGTLNLLELAREKKSEGFLFFSSGAVYGDVREDHLPLVENYYGPTDPLDVRACYAESKRMGETMCVAWHHQFQVPTKIARLFHTYGPGVSLDDSRSFADFTSDVVKNRNIELHTDGLATRSFLYIADATVGFFKILLDGIPSEAYNLGTGIETSILELTHILVNIFPEKKLKVIQKISTPVEGYLQNPITRIYPDITKIKTKLGFKWKFSIAEGFKRMILSYNEPFCIE